MKNKYAWVGSIVGIVLVLDQITKYIIEKNIRTYDVIAVIPGFFNITNIRNRGAAFGILSSAPDLWRSAFFIVVALVAVGVISLLIKHAQERFLVTAFSLIAGGALGNVIDRIRYGEVVDFIDWHVRTHHWPAFNVADAVITIGVCLLAIDMLFDKQQGTGENSKS